LTADLSNEKKVTGFPKKKKKKTNAGNASRRAEEKENSWSDLTVPDKGYKFRGKEKSRRYIQRSPRDRPRPFIGEGGSGLWTGRIIRKDGRTRKICGPGETEEKGKGQIEWAESHRGKKKGSSVGQKTGPYVGCKLS